MTPDNPTSGGTGPTRTAGGARRFRAGAVLTRAGAPLLRRSFVDVENGIITSVGTSRSHGHTPTDVDLEGLVLIPGLIDAHVHLGFDASQAPERLMTGGDLAAVRRHARETAHAVLRLGVTTVRDLGCVDSVFPLSVDGTDSSRGTAGVEGGAHAPGPSPCGGTALPRILYAGRPITTTGGHCHYMADECEDLASVLEAIDRRHREGSQVVKFMLTGGFMHAEGDTPFRAVYSVAIMSAAVRHAHTKGLRVAAHAHGTEGIRVAVAAGVDSIEHCSMARAGDIDLDMGLVGEMVARGTVAVPTVSRLWDEPLPWASAEDAVDVIGALHRSGVPIVLGTDLGICGVLPGAHVDGLAVLARAGMTGDALLAAATTSAAALCGVGDTVGALESGYVADFIAVTADPRDNLDVLRSPALVVSNGMIVFASDDVMPACGPGGRK